MSGDDAHTSPECEIAGNGMRKFVSRQASVGRDPHQLHHLLRWVALEDAEGFRGDGPPCKMHQGQLRIGDNPRGSWSLCEGERNGHFLCSRGGGSEDGERAERGGSRVACDRHSEGVVMAVFGGIAVRRVRAFLQLSVQGACAGLSTC